MTSKYSSSITANTLFSFAMYVAFPRSDYYENSAPPKGCQLTTSLPISGLDGQDAGKPKGGSHVHC